VIEDFLDPSENHNSKYSIAGKSRHLSVQSAKNRIETLRKLRGDLISAKNNRMDEQNMDNVFINSSKETEPYSMSLYNGKSQFSRPVTAPTS